MSSHASISFCVVVPLCICWEISILSEQLGGDLQKLQKVQINKLSSSLSRERAEAAELSEVAEMMGMASPHNRALSPPGSPGRAFRSPCRPQSRPTSARSVHTSRQPSPRPRSPPPLLPSYLTPFWPSSSCLLHHCPRHSLLSAIASAIAGRHVSRLTLLCVKTCVSQCLVLPLCRPYADRLVHVHAV